MIFFTFLTINYSLTLTNLQILIFNKYLNSFFKQINFTLQQLEVILNMSKEAQTNIQKNNYQNQTNHLEQLITKTKIVQDNTNNQQSQMFLPNSTKYYAKFLYLNNQNLSKFQTSHIMIMYFLIHGISTENQLQNSQILNKQKIISYIKSLQLPNGGYGPSSLYTQYENDHKYNLPHIVFTYSAINTLIELGAQKYIDKQKCIKSILRCQKQNGSFSNFENSNEADLRFVYAAVAICKNLNELSSINKEKIIQYLQSCYNFDGGYGLRPYCQSHSGAIYCAIATFKMLDVQIPHKFESLQFLVNRQSQNQNSDIVGVQGRVGKIPDSCYTFWVGSSIQMITEKNLLNPNIQNFLKLCFNQKQRSFSKYPNIKGDPLHTLHSNIGLKIIKDSSSDLNIITGANKPSIQ